eukprot:5780700-Pleurochrysis_carterae.AAC.2
MRPLHPSTDGPDGDVEPHNPQPVEGVAHTPAPQACRQAGAQPVFAKATGPAHALDTEPVLGYAEDGCLLSQSLRRILAYWLRARVHSLHRSRRIVSSGSHVQSSLHAERRATNTLAMKRG